MSDSTAPILITGGMIIVDRMVFLPAINKQGPRGNPQLLQEYPNPIFPWKVAIATGAAAVIFSGLEKVMGDAARTLAWVVLLTTFLYIPSGKSQQAAYGSQGIVKDFSLWFDTVQS